MAAEQSPNGDSFSRRVVEALDRQAQAFDRQAQALDQLEASSRLHSEILRASFDGFMARLEDMGDQIRANTQAVLLALDRLDGGQQPST